MLIRNVVPCVVTLALSVVACKKDETAQKSSGAQGATDSSGPLRLSRGVLIAHALGAIGPLENTNSLEALKCNYQRGFRWFEVDLALTADDHLVCFHRGDEKLAKLSTKISKLPLEEVEATKYAGRFQIVPFATLLGETERLENVVLVLDTEGWSERIQAAVSRTMSVIDKATSRRTRIVLQAYDEADLTPISAIKDVIGAGVMLNLDHTQMGDEKVEQLAKKYPLIAVLTDSKRFTPWLAQRLHTIEVPIVVHTLNEHRDIVSFMRAGVDGFYTDRYVPYETMAADPVSAASCGPPIDERHPWAERDAMRPRQFRLARCAKRGADRIDLASCSERAALYGAYLPVPPDQHVHVELEAEASGSQAASLWFDVIQKSTPSEIRPREEVHLKAGERRSLHFDFTVPQGSAGIEPRVGLLSTQDRVTIYRFKVSQGEATASPAADAEEDAG